MNHCWTAFKDVFFFSKSCFPDIVGNCGAEAHLLFTNNQAIKICLVQNCVTSSLIYET